MKSKINEFKKRIQKGMSKRLYYILFALLLFLLGGKTQAQCYSGNYSANAGNITWQNTFNTIAQSFKITCSDPVTSVRFYSDLGAVTGATSLVIMSGSGHSGTVLYTVTNPIFTDNVHTLTLPLTITLGNTYTIKMVNYTISESGKLYACNGSPSCYSDGTCWYSNNGGNTWAAGNNNYDFKFQITQASAPVVNIPNANFKAYLVGNSAINTNGDTEIQVSEAEAFTGSIYCVNKNIADLTGIEAFTKITELYCSTNQLTNLDISKNTALTDLMCYGNQLASLDVSKNTALRGLACNSNQLTSLDVSKNTDLRGLACESNQLTALDVSKNTSLRELTCQQNQLTSLDVKNGQNSNITYFIAKQNPNLTCIQVDDASASHTGWQKDATASYSEDCTPAPVVYIPDANFKNYLLSVSAINTNGDTEIQVSEAEAFTGTINCSYQEIADLTGIEAFVNLTQLNCFYNQLTSLDISKNTALTRLDCGINRLTSLDVTQNTALGILDCRSNQLTSLDVSKNTALTYLGCGENQLTTLDVSKNTALGSLVCYINQLTNLDVTQNTALTQLVCYQNQLTSLDVTQNIALTDLSCYQNQLISLDVSKNTALTFLYCAMNQLTNLDVTKNTALIYLICNQNQLTSLDISKNTALGSLACDGNQLTSLDVSKNTALIDLRCSINQLTNLDVSKNTALGILLCHQNQLTSLDVTQNIALTNLWCDNNQLTSLDVTKNTALTDLGCSGNQLTSLDISKNTALTRLDCSVNQLTSLDVKNGQNSNITYFNTTDNPNLTCIQVDDASASYLTSWGKDATASYSEDCTPASVVYIPDTNFKAHLLSTSINTNGDNEIQVSEAVAFTGTINCSNKNIADLTGIEAFVNITKLFCDRNQLTSLDVTKNIALTELTCYQNQLTSLDVTQNIALTNLWCDNNQLTSLDVTKNTALTDLGCSGNQLTSLDISKNTALTRLDCSVNQLTSLDVKNGQNSNITYFNTTDNPNLTCIQVDDASASYLTSWGKDATASYSEDCTPASVVYIPDTNFKAHLLSTSINTNGDNEIQVSEAVAFTGTINCSNKNIADLTGIEAFVNITKLFCDRNQLTSLDVTKNIALTELTCYQNQLTSLDVSKNTAFTNLQCYSNQLTSLDVSKNTALTVLTCYSNQLTSLDVTKNTALRDLRCHSNQLTSLDTSKNTALLYLYCEQNQLTNLDVSKNTALINLWCNGNQLTSLDVTKNTDLTSLRCYQNQLTSLDVKNGQNNKITGFDARQNPNLTCIQVDNASASHTGWFKDSTASYSEDCTPICNAPTDLTATSITINSAVLGWTSPGSSFDIEYGTAGFTQGTGTQISDITSNSRTVASLSSNTQYQFYVRRDCGTNESVWAGPFSFTTLKSAKTALNFDGTNDYLEKANPVNLPVGSAARSMEVWVKTSGNVNYFRTIANYGITANSRRFGILIAADNGRPYFVGEGNDMQGTVSVTDGNWHHIAVTYTGGTNGTVSMYIDGVLNITSTKTLNTASGPLRIGRRVDGGANTEYFNGTIDEVRIWNYALTQSEIQARKDKELTSLENGLVSYFNFNKGVAGGNNGCVAVIDDMKGSNDVTVNNFAMAGAASNFVADGIEGEIAETIDCGTLAAADINKKEISVYPNPVKDVLHFSEEVSEIRIMDMSGRMIKQISTKGKSVNLSGLSAGNYIVKIKTINNETTFKIIKN